VRPIPGLVLNVVVEGFMVHDNAEDLENLCIMDQGRQPILGVMMLNVHGEEPCVSSQKE
jgi:hypothetical protein